jgi:hypothetical protein
MIKVVYIYKISICIAKVVCLRMAVGQGLVGNKFNKFDNKIVFSHFHLDLPIK